MCNYYMFYTYTWESYLNKVQYIINSTSYKCIFVDSPLSSSRTPSLVHSRLKPYLFHKYFPS